MRPKRLHALRPSLDRLEGRCLLSANPQGLSPSQLKTAYGLNNLQYFTQGVSLPADGWGETIAIIEVDHDPYLASDLAKFDATYGLSNPTNYSQAQPGAPWLSQFNLAGGTTDPGWAEEETLDVEWAHAMAPRANLLVMEAASGSTADLLQAIAAARATPGVGIVSMSWGVPEFPNESAYDVYFTTPPGHVGITYVAAAGDTPGVEWPAASPNVLSVGGTTLSTAPATGAYLNEAAWGPSGGGYSRYEPEPAYQYKVQSTGLRSVPDVAFDGNPNTGVSVYTTNPRNGVGTWSVFGGTSLGSPAWSGIVAIIDEGYALAHIVASMDGPGQTLPILYGRPAGTFHAVYTANFTAAAGLTQVGRGTPNGAALIESMLGNNILIYNGPSSAGSAAAAVPAVGLAAAPAARTAGAATATPAIVAATVTPATSAGPGQAGATSAPVPAFGLAAGGPRTLLAARPALAMATPGGITSSAPGAGPDGRSTIPALSSGISPAVVLSPDPGPSPAMPPAPAAVARSMTTGRVGPRPILAATAPVVTVGPVTLAPLEVAPPLDRSDESLRWREDEEFGPG